MCVRLNIDWIGLELCVYMNPSIVAPKIVYELKIKISNKQTEMKQKQQQQQQSTSIVVQVLDVVLQRSTQTRTTFKTKER